MYKKLKIESNLNLIVQNFVHTRRTILEKSILEYATADILISMLREAYFVCMLFTDRRKKNNSPHRRCEIKTGTHALVETVAVLTRNPYHVDINIRESTVGIADIPVVRYYFSIYSSAGGTSARTIQRGINLSSTRTDTGVQLKSREKCGGDCTSRLVFFCVRYAAFCCMFLINLSRAVINTQHENSKDICEML